MAQGWKKTLRKGRIGNRDVVCQVIEGVWRERAARCFATYMDIAPEAGSWVSKGFSRASELHPPEGLPFTVSLDTTLLRPGDITIDWRQTMRDMNLDLLLVEHCCAGRPFSKIQSWHLPWQGKTQQGGSRYAVVSLNRRPPMFFACLTDRALLHSDVFGRDRRPSQLNITV